MLNIYLLYNLGYFLVESADEGFQSFYYMLNEFIAWGGLIISYPLLCHFAARALVVKKTNQAASFIQSIPNTVILVFWGLSASNTAYIKTQPLHAK